MPENTKDAAPASEAAPLNEARPGEMRLERTYRLDLRVGARAMLRFGWGDGKNALELPAELIGYSHYEFMLVRVQPVPGLLQRTGHGELVQMRFLSDGEATIFQTEIISYLQRPGIILTLAYPQTMNIVQVRKHKRLACVLPVRAGKDGRKLSGIISDLSRGGCRMIADVRGQSAFRSLAVGDILELVVPLDIEKGLENIKAMVRNVETEQFRMILGLSFEPMSSQTLQLLDNFLSNTEILLS